MVAPDRRRIAVRRLRDQFGVSERRACGVVGQPRSTQRRAKAGPSAADETLRRRLRQIARKHPRWGWRKAHDIAAREELVVNPKRTRRIWRDEGLQRPAPKKRKRRRRSDGTAGLLRAEYPLQVWSLDFQFDETSKGRRLKLLNILDEHTREALAMKVEHSITADDVVDLLAQLIEVHGAPQHLRMDNGPELVAWALRDWCRIWGTNTAYIEPGSPWENPFIESFHSRVRDELLNVEDFYDLTDAKIVVEDWRIQYNRYRPHRSLDGLTPSQYRQQWETDHP